MSDVIMQYDHTGRVFARQSNKTLILEPDAKGLFVAADLSKTDLATEIAAGLIEYDQNVADEIKTIVDDVAQEGVDELKQSSPKLTGSYRRGWRKKQTYADTRTKRNTVFNKTDYQITHLLEYGHASRNGGRVKPSVHIKPVEEKMITELQERIEKAVQQ